MQKIRTQRARFLLFDKISLTIKRYNRSVFAQMPINTYTWFIDPSDLYDIFS